MHVYGRFLTPKNGSANWKMSIYGHFLKYKKHQKILKLSDNGKEFANHEIVSEELEAEFYFTKPYHSWERGLNEHTNGLVRQYFPKAKRFDDIFQEDLDKVEVLLNNRPRKVLNFETPQEVF